MVYQPVIMKRLLGSDLLGRFAIPWSRTAASTVFDRFSPTFGRRSYHARLKVKNEREDPDIYSDEDEENCYLEIHMPGLNKEDVKSHVEIYGYTYLHVNGAKVQEDHERVEYKDIFEIPKYINGSGTIIGKMSDGELTITLPKLKEGEKSNEKLELEIN